MKPASIDKILTQLLNNFRFFIQAIITIAFICYSNLFANGKISNNLIANGCFPGLNCFYCSMNNKSMLCPLGALQMAAMRFNLDLCLYIGTIFIFIGSLLGRFVCGWLCPFGFVQDTLYKIKTSKKINTFRGDHIARYLKYGILFGLVIAIQMYGNISFCSYCPMGIYAQFLTGISPDLIINFLLSVSILILVIIIIFSIIIYRPFCKYICPLGAMYGLLNHISLYRMHIETEKCTKCGACAKVCKMRVNPIKTPNSAECIRCGSCIHACPRKALDLGINLHKLKNR